MFPWFAVQVRGRFEDQVQMRLEGQGFDPFLPKYGERRKWSDRMQTVQVPLFPGYLFCRFDPQQRRPIVTTPGVLGVVGIAKTPIPVSEEEITAIRTIIDSGSPALPCAYLRGGDKVRVECGPLRGLEGILIGFRGQARVIVSVTLLQRSVAVDVNSDWLRSLETSRAGNMLVRQVQGAGMIA